MRVDHRARMPSVNRDGRKWVDRALLPLGSRPMQKCLACSGAFGRVVYLGEAKSREAALSALQQAAEESTDDRHFYVDHLLDTTHVLSLCKGNLEGRASE